MEYNLAAF